MSPLITQKRLIRIEASLTPKQAVLLWLRQEHQGKTSDEYLRWMMQRPPSAAPRPRVGKQVAGAIRVAAKGQGPSQVQQAVRQAQMQTDFLILLVNRTNWVILNDSQVRWLKIVLLYEQLRNAVLSDNEERGVNEWAGSLRTFATELFSLQAASTLIRERYFDGERILLNDAIADLEQQTKLVRDMMDAYDRAIAEAGQPELATDSHDFRIVIGQRASERADYVVALAKSKMLDDFGEPEAAYTVLKLHIFE